MKRKAATGPDLPVFGPVLGIETSCDETAVAVLVPDGRILAELVWSQIEDHASFGGVVPEIAARAHLALLPGMVAEALHRAKLAAADLGAIAATAGPGLIGGLIAGANFAKGMALAADLPFIAINHLEAHALTARLPQKDIDKDIDAPEFPYLLLLVSGGHCQLLAVEGVGAYRRLGTTLDDAAGEAFDKVAKLLGLPYPGGAALERLAASGDAARIVLPRPMLGRPGCDFSFSGLKTAVAQLAAAQGAGALEQKIAADIAAGFQASVVAVLADRVGNALAMMPAATAVVAAGGVAANRAIRTTLAEVAGRFSKALHAPPLPLCTDNAVMVAWAAIERLRCGGAPDRGDPLDVPCLPRWPL